MSSMLVFNEQELCVSCYTGKNPRVGLGCSSPFLLQHFFGRHLLQLLHRNKIKMQSNKCRFSVYIWCNHLKPQPTTLNPPTSRLQTAARMSFPAPIHAAISSLPLLNYKCIYSTVKRMSIAGFPAAGRATVCGGHRGKGSNGGQSLRPVSLPLE